MHKFVSIITKHPGNIHRIINDKCECGDWDWAVPGGRYSNLIPVGMKCKPVEGFLTIGQPNTNNGFPFETLPNNPRRKYVSAARIRNIDRAECDRLHQLNAITILEPYSFILDDEDVGDDAEYILDENSEEARQMRMLYADILSSVDKQSWYVVIVDVHW